MSPSDTRRRLLLGATGFGATSMLGLPPGMAAEPPPETTRIRLVHAPAICLAPQYLAEDLLRLEGFTDIRYEEMVTGAPVQVIEARKADITMDAAPASLYSLDAGNHVVVLAGIHAGCYELIGNDRIHAIRDLKGKTIAVMAVGGGDHVLVSSMLAYVGVNPRTEVKWIMENTFDTMRLFMEGKADAIMGFAPQPQELRERGIGHVIVNTALDRPWSQYFCCVVTASREFVAKYPVATKRALRAFLKAADICAADPEAAARMLAERKYETREKISLEVLKTFPYRRWRDANPEDTLRFHALRLHEVGMIKSTPDRIIANGTDWRFFNELKRELKA
jgi:NitT/TauT family transport system substrate-binding protein